MSILSSATSGIKEVPQINLIYGPEKIGKTTLTSKFPSPICFDIEGGSLRVDTFRVTTEKLTDYKAVLAGVDDLLNDKHNFKTLNIDSISVLERYIHTHLCGTKYTSIEDYAGGFGKGYTAAKDEASKFMKNMAELRDKRNMTINLVGHSMEKAHTDPYDQVTYNRHVPQCNEKFAQVIKQLSDNIFFIKRVISTHQDSKTKKTFASTDGDRLIITEWSPAADAGNRLNLPPTLPLDYAKLVDAIKLGVPKSAPELFADIKVLVKQVDKEVADRAMAKADLVVTQADELLRIKTKLTEMVRTQEGA